MRRLLALFLAFGMVFTLMACDKQLPMAADGEQLPTAEKSEAYAKMENRQPVLDLH